MRKLTLVVVFIVVWQAASASAMQQEFVLDTFLSIAPNTSSIELTLTSEIARTEIECVMKCPPSRVCVGATFQPENGACHVLVANQITEAPPGTLGGLNLTADTVARLWFAENLMSVLQRLVVEEVVFTNSSTGRTGLVQNYTVPSTGCYLIRAFGARGGSHRTVYDGSPSTTFSTKFWYGGLGAFKAGRFHLTTGTELSIVVGQSGGNSSEMTPSYPTYPEDNAGAGGGGGSFVYRSSDNYLLLAAGGGGGGSNGFQGVPGQSGTAGASSVGASSSQSYPGGTSGGPGTTNPASASYHGGPGAGWNGRFGTARQGTSHGDRGGGRSEGWVGGVAGGMNPGAVGGFGGGGGGSEDNGASGGGGGYSGGGAGTHEKQAGGGGGSFCSGVACEGLTGGNSVSDQGRVTIRMFGPTCD